MPTLAFPIRALSFAVALLALAGCESSPTAPEADPGATLTVDASDAAAWALVDLGTPAVQVQAADPAGSGAWDIAFRATGVMVNGGTNGPGGVVVYCLCQNAGATDAQVMEMTPEVELADFEAITGADIPAAGSGWSATTFEERRWYRYNLTGSDHQVWPTYEVYFVKRGAEVFKVQVTGYYSATVQPRHITFRYARLTG